MFKSQKSKDTKIKVLEGALKAAAKTEDHLRNSLRILQDKCETLRKALGEQAAATPPAAGIVEALHGKERDPAVQSILAMIRHQRRISIECASDPDATDRQATLELGGGAALDTLLVVLTQAFCGNVDYLKSQGYAA